VVPYDLTSVRTAAMSYIDAILCIPEHTLLMFLVQKQRRKGMSEADIKPVRPWQQVAEKLSKEVNAERVIE